MAKRKLTVETETFVIEDRPSIKLDDKFKLYVRSGGRCAICNKYLIDIQTGINLGEMAHIVGWTNKKGSPRGLSAMPQEERNFETNLILLCSDDHKIIDNAKMLNDYTVERLIEAKKEHENRIHHLTNLSRDRDTVVLRMLGNIRGATVEMSQKHALDIVFKEEKRAAVFLDSFDKQSIEIDLTKLPEPEEDWDSYWSLGQKTIDKELRKFEEGIRAGTIRHLSVFAISRIPLLAYLGYKLGDKIPMSLYQKHRGEEETWGWIDKDGNIEFEINKIHTADSDNVILVLSISGNVDIAKLPQPLAVNSNIFVIKPSSVIPNRDIFNSKKTYDNFVKKYHEFLSQLEIDHKNCDEIHLFPAVPILAAIACGRGIMRNVHPSLLIYDFTGKNYVPTITLNVHETN
ncbi:SAVED domain-containing protein [Sphingobacterium thalpophilum]|uniref:SAVED domain-containing protein n=1 Tax=Sphingobacterium thalpophilum TaxID=259 RepID=UPI002D78BFCF|nr:SAVED domain-containing protein [Sphingobacterium thalpophilum]